MATLRKKVGRVEEPAERSPVGFDPATTTVQVTSELESNPVDDAFDGTTGPGATRWIAAEDGVQSITLVFDSPRDVTGLLLEVEERERERTQQVTVEVSRDGRRYDELVRQEFVFSPRGATFERESWRFDAHTVTHLRLTVTPDKSGSGRASITALALA